MKKTYLVTAVAALLALCTAVGAFALEPYAIRENVNAPGGAGGPCALSASTNGTAANYRWYNVCSGYIWIFSALSQGEGFGVRFGGASQPAVNGDNDVKRGITYWRNVVANYGQTVDIYLDADSNGDGCPEANLASDLNLDPGLRWNCSDFGVSIPCGDTNVVLRGVHDGGAAPTIASDGPFTATCDPNAPNQSFYYGINGSACLSWVGPDGTFDNFLFWLVLDTSAPCVNATESKSWGEVKGLYR
ncbi:MAG: hypothetical protein ACKVU1_08190 [bacterium]